MTRSEPSASASDEGRLRIDKWLWAARFYRTRALAVEAIEAGHVEVAGERTKRSRGLRCGERVRIRKGPLAWEVEVLALSDRRGPAAEAALLYREAPESIAVREEAIARRRAAEAASPAAAGRPTKRQRRKLEDFLNEP